MSPWVRRLARVTTAILSVAYLLLGAEGNPPNLTAGAPDWVVHGGAYALLSAVATIAAAGVLASPARAGAVFAFGHGALLEVVQFFNPPRRAEWGDLLADVVGAALGAALAAAVVAGRRCE